MADVAASSSAIATTAQAVTGNIEPGAIQIDGGAAGADLFANVGTPLNSGATLDWVKDSLANSGTSCLGSDDVATCIQPGVTGATGGTGHWNGVRIVDGLNSSDQDIFLNGGKENDTTTWNPGPGSVGSSKYDITQAYLANNQTTLFFGMERAGNNGTTAFDFEFNQNAPGSLPGCSTNAEVPCRAVGDVLFTFLMQGSGGSGSATPFVFTWNGTAYVAASTAGTVASINDSTSTAGGPWGHVNSQGNWVTGNLDRFQFAEAAAPLSLLPGVNACGGTAFVQVRTRSSETSNSDLKDLTKIFTFRFNSVSATGSLTGSCDGTLGYQLTSAIGADGKPLSNPSCSWTFSNGATSSTCSGSLTALAAGSYSATLVVSDSSASSCTANASAGPAALLAPIAVDLVVSTAPEQCTTDAATFTASASGGDGNYTYEWSKSTCSGTTCTIDPADSTFCDDETISVTVGDDSGVCPSQPSPVGSYTKTTTVTASVP